MKRTYFGIVCGICGIDITDLVEKKKCFEVSIKDLDSGNEEFFYVCRECGLKKVKFSQ